MNERSRFPLALGWLSSLALAACSPAGGSEPPLQGARIGGPFSLTDQNGARFDSQSLAGKYRIVYFGYTFCPDVCPVDLQQIGLAMKRFEESEPERAKRVQPLFITTDPERDNPAVLKEFVAAFHPRLIGLTGTPQEIAAVSKAYAVYGVKQETPGASGYLVNHSRIAFLFGPKGEPIAILPHEEGAEAILTELKKWVA
ncbi:MAG TPA: SCO family protein [Allosphingosinicella sp.]|jgi:protein SCO1/2|uniref:SCO family protein n=1 Tax=Allosphingosinicella sp. TaxID=2823234 RepID=UPI002F2752E2